MEYPILLRLVTQVSSSLASLDEVVLRVQELLDTQGMAGVLSLLLSLMDRALLQAWRTGALLPPVCCAHPAYEVEGTRKRVIRTSVGRVSFAWHRLRCRHCHARWIPLRTYLGLQRQQRHSAELEQRGLEASSSQSYRQAARQTGVAKSTLHQWVRETTSDELPAPTEPDPVLEADGMVFHRHPDEVGGSTRGDLRVAIGISATGAMSIRGVWSGPAWDRIGNDVAQREGGPAIELVQDGEPGLAEGVGPAATYVQRCHRHLALRADAPLLADDLAVKLRRFWQQALSVILAIRLPDDATDPLQRADLRRTVRVTTDLLMALADEWESDGLIHGATYLRNALPYLFSYVTAWLATGRRLPRTTALIEGVMSQLTIRVKAIGRNWKALGVVKIARMILKRWKHRHEWLVYWVRRQHRTGSVQVSLAIS